MRLPKEFRFSGSEVYIRRVGNAIVLLPAKDSWEMLQKRLPNFTDDFLAQRILISARRLVEIAHYARPPLTAS